MSTEEHTAIIRRWVDAAWNQGDMAMAADLYPDSYVMHSPGLPAPVTGAAGITGFIVAYRAAFPDLHHRIDDMVAAGDKVAWRLTTTGTQRGELFGIPATGKAITVTSTVVSRFAAGKWVEDWVQIDQLGMLQQLGVIPTMAPAEA